MSKMLHGTDPSELMRLASESFRKAMPNGTFVLKLPYFDVPELVNPSQGSVDRSRPESGRRKKRASKRD